MRNRPNFANKNWLGRHWLALSGAATLALGTTIATRAWDDPKPAAPAGLKGILPVDVPVALSEDAFAALEGNWKEWAQTAAAEVTKLYSEETADVASQRKQLEVLGRKLKTLQTSLQDARYQSIHQTLFSLHSALSRRVALAEAVLDTLALDPKKSATARLDGSRNELTKALANLAADLKGVKNGDAWLSYVRSAEIAKLVSEKKGSTETVPVLTAVQKKLSPSDSMSAELRQFLSGAKFGAVREAVDQYLKVSAAVDQEFDAEKLRASLTNLVGALEKFEETGSSVDAAAVRKAFEGIRKVSPDGGDRIAGAMATHYFNFNLRVVTSEKFLTRIANQTTKKQGPVDDFILGAKVDGSQVTTATVNVDLKPANNGVRLNITLSGVSQSSTIGVTEEANVYTSGYHQFWAWKPVIYDGTKFHTEKADISVAANNTTTGVDTAASGIPLLGSIADSIARGEVAKKRPQAEAIAAQRVSSRVLPEFNQEVDEKITKMNHDLDTGVNARLKKQNLWPSATSYRSSETDMRANLRLMEAGELAGSDGPFTAVPSSGFVVALHQSLLNNSMDRLKFHGRTIPEEQLKSEIEKSFSDLLGRPFNANKKIEAAAPSASDPATFIFPEHDPIHFRIDNGQLVLVIRAGLKQKPGEEDIPTQEITVPLMFRVEGTNLVVESGSVGVSPVDPPKSAGLQIARAGVVRTKIQGALPTRKFDRFFMIDKNVQTPVQVGLSSVSAAGGWMVLAFE